MGGEVTGEERMKATDNEDSQYNSHSEGHNNNDKLSSNKQFPLGLWGRPPQKWGSTQVLWVRHLLPSGICSFWTYSPFFFSHCKLF